MKGAMFEERKVRSGCRRLLKQLELTPPLDVTTLASGIGRLIGQEIRLVEWPLTDPEEPFAYCFRWSEGEDCYVIVYQKNAAQWHQDHFICHELGHVLLGHLDDPEMSNRIPEEQEEPNPDLAQIVNRLPFSGVPRRLRRSCYDTPQERSVELIATMLMEWAVVPGSAPTPPPPGPLSEEANHLYTALTYRRGWM